MGELELIRRFRAAAPGHPWLAVGPGQDCAVVNWPTDRDVAFKIDQVVEGAHFVLHGPGAATPREVGWKAMAKACSDIAAAGFWPVAATVAVNLRKGSDERLALEVYDGLVACCKKFSFALAGGDIAASENGLSVVVSLLGEGPKGGAWLRCGAKPGDALLVSGALGRSRETRKHLTFTPRLEEARLIRDICRDSVHACIDVTDGLSRDLRHLCDESACGAAVFADKIPHSEPRASASGGIESDSIQHALADGEDFELLLAIAPAAAEQLLAAWKQPVPLTQIGAIQLLADGRVLVDASGNRIPMPDLGYEHRT